MWPNGDLQTFLTSRRLSNSHEIIKRILFLRTVKLMNDYLIASFDETSLFISMPRNLAKASMKQILQQSQNIISKQTTTPYRTLWIYRTSRFAYCSYLNKLHTNISTDHLWVTSHSKSRITTKRRTNDASTQRKFYTRYIDEAFAIQKLTEVNTFITQIIQIFPETKFTKEDSNGSITFIDVHMSIGHRCTYVNRT